MSVASRVQQFQQLIRNILWLVQRRGLADELRQQTEFVRGIKQATDELRRMHRSRAWVYGHYMRLDPDDQLTTRYLTEDGCLEPFERELSDGMVRSGDTVVDVGANIGFYTLAFARTVGPQGHVFAFEPDPRNFELLQRNVRQNGYHNVTLVQKAVAAQTGKVKLYRNFANRGDHRIYASDSGREYVEVEAIRLDDYFASHEGPINFVKFDIQGAEAAAFQGMQSLLSRNPDLCVFTEFWPRGLALCGHDPERFLHDLHELGFQVSIINEQTQQLQPLDIRKLLDRLPVQPETDLYFTNLYCQRTAASYQQALESRRTRVTPRSPALSACEAA